LKLLKTEESVLPKCRDAVTVKGEDRETNMKGLRFHAAKDLWIEEEEAPSAPGAGLVVLRNHFIGICRTDLHE
jgi:hypothetical protein